MKNIDFNQKTVQDRIMDSVQEGYDAFLPAKRGKTAGNCTECRRMHGKGFDAVSSERESCFAFLCMFGFRAEGGLAEREPGPKCEQIAASCFLCGLIIFDLLFVSGFIIIKGKERCMKRNGTPCIKRFRCGFGTDAPAEGS